MFKATNTERVDAAQLAQLACRVGALAEAWDATAEYLAHPMACFRLEMRRRGRGDVVHMMHRYQEPLGLLQFKGDPEEWVESILREMSQEIARAVLKENDDAN